MKKQNPSSQSGFTLVELAIVLIIIGLLLGGILRGQELLANGRVTAIIEQTKAYTAAMKTFGEEYGSIPGDMPYATAKLPGCTAGNTCVNGNGDSVLGVLAPGGNNVEANEVWNDINPAIGGENAQFWKHLALAHLITGVDPSAKTAEWGRSNPTASIGGGFFARYANYTHTDASENSSSSHFFVLRNEITGTWDCGNGGAGDCSISPMRAAQIDRKADDGVATTGDIVAVSASWLNGCGTSSQGINGPNGYAESVSNNSCDIMFRVP